MPRFAIPKKLQVNTILRSPAFWLSCFLAFILICNYIWTRIETRPPHWDMARHLWTSLGYLDFLRHGHLAGWVMSYWYYPPLLYWLTAPLYVLFGTSISIAILVNAIFLPLLVFSTYGVGKLLWSKRTGLLAAILVATLPMFVTQFKEYQLDAPLAAMVMVSLYWLIRAKRFSDRRSSIWLGVSFGLGMLTKWMFPVFMVTPLFLATILFVRDLYRSKKRSDLIINFLSMIFIAYAITSIWYLPNMAQLRFDFAANGTQAGLREGDPIIGSAASNLWYIRSLFVNQLYLLPSILFLLGLGFSFARRDWLKRNSYLLALVFGSIVILSVLRNKDARYSLAILGSVSIIAVFWFEKLSQRWRMGLSILVGVYAAYSFLNISFGFLSLPARSIPVLGIGNVPVVAPHGYIIGPPSHEIWHQQDVFELIAARPHTVRSLGYDGLDSIWFNHWGMSYYATRYDVTMTDIKKHPTFWLSRSLVSPAAPSGYKYLRSFSLPDGSKAVLFERSL